MVRVIDASGCILGRLGSNIAKALLDNEDEEIALVNCEKVIVTGKKKQVLDKYKFKRNVGTARKGPYFPRVPHRMVKRTVRGMLPFQKARGRNAYKRLKCYIGVPPELVEQTPEVLASAQPRSITPHVELSEIAQRLGAKME